MKLTIEDLKLTRPLLLRIIITMPALFQIIEKPLLVQPKLIRAQWAVTIIPNKKRQVIMDPTSLNFCFNLIYILFLKSCDLWLLFINIYTFLLMGILVNIRYIWLCVVFNCYSYFLVFIVDVMVLLRSRESMDEQVFSRFKMYVYSCAHLVLNMWGILGCCFVMFILIDMQNLHKRDVCGAEENKNCGLLLE